VKRAVRRVDDPLTQRSMRRLHRTQALPRETRQYVPGIEAAIIAGHHLDGFGF
jgi:hypothetical protein